MGAKELITRDRARRALRAVLWIYIVLCVAIAGLNYGLAPKVGPRAAAAIRFVYQLYENELKTAFILVCGAIAFWSLGKRARMQRASIIGFGAAALVLHIAVPLITGNRDAYYFYMPLPWSSGGLQLLDPSASFSVRHLPLWGSAGMSAAILVFVSANAIVLAGTLLFGRRWQCSTLCLLNGFVCEIWPSAIPLAGKKKVPGRRARALLAAARWTMFALSLSFCAWWILRLAGLRLPGDPDAVAAIETWKYLCLELMVCMLFWVLWSGRGYCHYCPAGTALGLVGKLARQRIAADGAKCVSCGACSRACPMLLDVAGPASRGEALSDFRCTGCGHCVDACRAGALEYETAFLRAVKRAKT
jgi:ferredoxin-type protein NapH